MILNKDDANLFIKLRNNLFDFAVSTYLAKKIKNISKKIIFPENLMFEIANKVFDEKS